MNRRLVTLVAASCLVALVVVVGFMMKEGPAPEPVVDPAEAAAARAAAVDAIVANHQVEWPSDVRERTIAEGRAAIERAQCNRCHTIDDIAPSSRPTHCVSCHHWLTNLAPDHRTFTKLSNRYGRDVIERYQRNIEHYLEVPELTNVALRIRPEWIAEYIQNPHDLRPMLPETMVRSHISDEDARAIARYFAAVANTHDPYGELTAAPPEVADPAPSAERVEQGRQVFLTRACNACHTVGNVDTGKTREDLERMGMASALAPNLRFARERMDPDTAVAWILDPQRFHPETRMPATGLTVDDAEAVRDFLYAVDPELRPTPPVPELALPDAVVRPVGWAEVKERTLGRICVHCHMNDYERDPGPGNSGGYGWQGIDLRMRTYEMLVSGQHARPQPEGADPENRLRASVLTTDDAHSVPRLLEVMLLRRVEERRDRIEAFEDHILPPDHGTDVLGMPMGLPHIPDEELAILRAWIEQGCPGPTEVTGMGGIDDGFLVPDGPIEVNEGCQLRLPSATRPEWSTQEPPLWYRQSPNNPAARPRDTSMTETSVAPTTAPGGME